MNNKIKICFMMNGLYGGGAEKILQTLLLQLSQSKYDITLYGVVNEEFDNNLYPKNVTYKSVFSGAYNKGIKNSFLIKIINKFKLLVYNNFSAKVFYKLFIKGSYDVEIAFIEGYSTKIISGSHQKSKKIAWVHIDLEANHWTKIAYKNLEEEIETYRQFDKIISVSKNVQESFSGKFGITERLEVKYNPVDREEIIIKSKESINLQNTKNIRLVSVGRLEHQKGYDRLLKVALKLKQDGLNFQLWILGDGTQHQQLKTFIEDNKLNDAVTLLGFQTNPYKYIAASHVFISSSRAEGFSTVVTEALILGKPIVATNCSGMKELLGDSQYGLLVENNQEALYQGIKSIISNQTLLNQYQKASKTRSNHFDIKTTMKEIEKLWI